MFNIWEIYKKHFLRVEFIISLVLTLYIVVHINSIIFDTNIDTWLDKNKNILYPLIAAISGTLLGFIFTGISVIIAFSESRKLIKLTQSPQYLNIYKIYFSTIKYLAVTTALSIIGVIVENNSSISIYGLVIADSWDRILFYVLIFFAIISTFRIYRCLWILENVVEIITMNKTEN